MVEIEMEFMLSFDDMRIVLKSKLHFNMNALRTSIRKNYFCFVICLSLQYLT